MKKTEITQERKILLGKIHIARKALGLDEETYRSVIFAAVGKTSGKACTDRQLLKVVKAFEEKAGNIGRIRTNIAKFRPDEPIWKKSMPYGGIFRIWAQSGRRIWLTWITGFAG